MKGYKENQEAERKDRRAGQTDRKTGRWDRGAGRREALMGEVVRLAGEMDEGQLGLLAAFARGIGKRKGAGETENGGI